MVSGFGSRPRSTRPISASHPPQNALAPGVDEAENEHEHEGRHLGEPESAISLETGRPREDEDGLDVEEHEQQGEDVVTDLALRPPVADRVDAALVRDVLLRSWARR